MDRKREKENKKESSYLDSDDDAVMNDLVVTTEAKAPMVAMPWKTLAAVMQTLQEATGFDHDLTSVVMPYLQPYQDLKMYRLIQTLCGHGGSTMLSGKPGTGKTYTVQRAIEAFAKENEDGEFAVTSMTGITASQLTNGRTIHSWGGVGILDKSAREIFSSLKRKNTEALARWRKAKCLIIDEFFTLSGVDLDLLEEVARMARGSPEPFGGLRLFVTGDPLQLPPVDVLRNKGLVWDAECFKSLNLTQIELTHIHRQQSDLEFIQILSRIRFGRFTPADIRRLVETKDNTFAVHTAIGIKPTYLVPHVKTADETNQRETRKLKGTIREFAAEDKGLSALTKAVFGACRAPLVLELGVGSQVLYLQNNEQASLWNGSRGVVVGFDDKAPGYPKIHFAPRGGIGPPLARTIWPYQFRFDRRGQSYRKQLPLQLAWAITIHKSQGQTLDCAVLDCGGIFAEAQFYVGLSRVRSLADIRILNLHSPGTQIRAHPRAVDFYRRNFSLKNAKSLGTSAPLNWDEKFMSISGTYAKEIFALPENPLDEKGEPSVEYWTARGKTLASIAQLVFPATTPEMKRGHEEEEYTAMVYTDERRLNEGLAECPRVRHGRFYRHPKYAWLCATSDRSVEGKQRRGLECKFVAQSEKTLEDVMLHCRPDEVESYFSAVGKSAPTCPGRSVCRCPPPDKFRDQLQLTLRCTGWDMMDLAQRSTMGFDYLTVWPDPEWDEAFDPKHIEFARMFLWWYWAHVRTEAAMQNFIEVLSKTQKSQMRESQDRIMTIEDEAADGGAHVDLPPLRFLAEIHKVKPPPEALIRQTREYILAHDLAWLEEMDPDALLDWNPRHQTRIRNRNHDDGEDDSDRPLKQSRL